MRPLREILEHSMMLAIVRDGHDIYISVQANYHLSRQILKNVTLGCVNMNTNLKC